MHPNQATLEKFYAAFARLDSDTMATCYAPDAQFDDEAFRCAATRKSPACGTCCATSPRPRAPTCGS
jgi:hypothetical protein